MSLVPTSSEEGQSPSEKSEIEGRTRGIEGGSLGLFPPGKTGVWQTLLPPSRGGLEAASKPPMEAEEPAREPQSAPGMETASQSGMALYVF